MKTEFKVGSMRMICAQSEVVERKYHKYGEKGNIYLVADQPNSADNIYCGYDHDTKSGGFGGAWLTFPLVDGEEIKLQGPWHTNSEALLAHTGVDIRDKHSTLLVIGKAVEYFKGDWNPLIKDLVYCDEEWKIGRFDRKEEIEEMLNKHQVPLFVYKESKSGSSSGWEYPGDTKHKDWEEYLAEHSFD